MIIRIIAYFIILIAVISIAMRIVLARPQWSSNSWQKILVYCIAFVFFIGGCKIVDIIMNMLNIN